MKIIHIFGKQIQKQTCCNSTQRQARLPEFFDQIAQNTLFWNLVQNPPPPPLKFSQILALWVLTTSEYPPGNWNLGRSWHFEFWLIQNPPPQLRLEYVETNLFIPQGYHLVLFISEYYKGSLNVILSAPHGGSVKPSFIPKRDTGCWDSGTEECLWSHDCTEKDSSKWILNLDLIWSGIKSSSSYIA